MEKKIVYEVEREFLKKITVEELVRRIIQSHKTIDTQKKAV